MEARTDDPWLSARPPRCHREFAPGDTLGGYHEMLGELSRREETPTHGSLALPWSLPSARAHKPRAALGRSGCTRAVRLLRRRAGDGRGLTNPPVEEED